jgi:hypothetical protein
MNLRFSITLASLLSVVPAIVSTVSAAQSPIGGLNDINPRLAAMGVNYRLGSVEWITDSGEIGQVVIFNDRGNRQSSSHWVPYDPDRTGLADIFTIIDAVEGATTSGLTEPETTAAIERAFQTWEDVACSTIPITHLGSVPVDLGVVQFVAGFGGGPTIAADVTHAGFLPQAFFELFFPGGPAVLAATFTLNFVDGGGNPTDINNDRKADTAFRETYYNDARGWGIDDDIDVESVALHETGHGLTQVHFGKLQLTDANGKFHFSPRAVMNAGYTGVQQELTGNDRAGHCSIWSSWPNR